MTLLRFGARQSCAIKARNQVCRNFLMLHAGSGLLQPPLWISSGKPAACTKANASQNPSSMITSPTGDMAWSSVEGLQSVFALDV